jgi:hypothetical protein
VVCAPAHRPPLIYSAADQTTDFGAPRTAIDIAVTRLVRFYLSRLWQCAIVRRVPHEPVTHHVQASLLQRHPACRLRIAAEVAEAPEPTLR